MPKLWWQHVHRYYPTLVPKSPPLQLLGFSLSPHPKHIFLVERRKRQNQLRNKHQFAIIEYKRHQRTWWVKITAGPCFFLILAILFLAGIITAMFEYVLHPIFSMPTSFPPC
jgi:hypothetical protein